MNSLTLSFQRAVLNSLVVLLLLTGCGPTTPTSTPVTVTTTAVPPKVTPSMTPTPTPTSTPLTPEPELEPGEASFSLVDSGQRLGNARSWDVELGDLDSDGDLDAFVANDSAGDIHNTVWLNDGQGTFSAVEQALSYANGAALGDLDNDGDLDAFVVGWEAAAQVWLNEGDLQGSTPGTFSDSGQVLGDAGGWDVALGDLDGDGDLDAFVAHTAANTVWLNAGGAQGGAPGMFIDSAQRLGEGITAAVALEDLDQDGDLDAVTAGWNEPAKVWINDGVGGFSYNEHPLTPGYVHVHGMNVGDLDDDGDSDAYLAGGSGYHQVWFNGGDGIMRDSEQQLSCPAASAVALGDLDGDGDLDIFVATGDRGSSQDKVWLNDGGIQGGIPGYFTDSGFTFSPEFSSGVGLGDLDGDGDLDAFVAHGDLGLSRGGGIPNEVWLNEVPTLASEALPPLAGSGGGVVAFTSERDGNTEIYIMNADGSDQRRLTDDPAEDAWPTWSPDGSQIAFMSDRGGNPDIYVVSVDDAEGGHSVRQLTYDEANDIWPEWSPDGTRIAFLSRRDGNFEIYVIDADGTDLQRLTHTSAAEDFIAWSPDGTRITFASWRDGDGDIYVMDADGQNVQKLTDNRFEDEFPAWRPDPTAIPAYIPLFEPAPCQFPEPSGYALECGYLTVPEDRSQPRGAQIRLHIAIFESTSANPKPDPVVHLVGGPGGSLLDGAGFYLKAGGDAILEERDYIMFNQRGTHYAEPFLACPGRTEFHWELAGQELTLEQRDRQEVAFLLDCQEDLLDQGIHLPAYNSAENAADVNDLRIALGYEKVNLYGISYGSRLALTMMRDHPDGIRSVILDGVFPPQANLNQDIAHNVHRSLTAVFEDCAADPDCNQAHPDLEATFYQIADELNTQPLSMELSGGTVVVDGYAFVEGFFHLLYSADAIPWIPSLIDQAARGEYPETSIFEVPDRRAWGTGMYYAIWCREEMPFESYETTRSLAADLPLVLGDLFAGGYDWSVCPSWASGIADPIENEAVVSDIPTLVLSGRYDPVTPPAWGSLAAETLANSFVYEFPNLAHGAMRSHPCALEIGLQFLDDPTVEPDTSCLETLDRPKFE